MFKTKSVLAGAAVAALLTATTSVDAATIYKQDKFDGDAGTTSTFNGNGSANVRVVGGPRTVNAAAGGFALTDNGGTLGDFVAWCLDILNNLNIPDTGSDYNVTTTPFSNTTGLLDPTRAANIQSLFNTGYSTVDLSSDSESGGFQLALWELLYEDTAAFSLTGGSFTQTKSDATALAANSFAQGLLDNIGGPATRSYRLTFLETATQGGSQNLVTATPVPLPAAFWMLGLAVAGTVAAGRRKKA